ncbi:MAG: HRDC domain-containing protein, partial [Trichloromonas sp.]|nr:HRDC domain-containing protein [Trichloromonas sp.]
LLEVARKAPKTLEELAAVEGLFAKLVERFGKKLLAAVAAGLAVPAERLPVYPRAPRQEKDPAVDKRMATLKAWRKQRAEALEIDPGVLINNGLLETLARQVPRTPAQLDQVAGLKNWQRQVLGGEILDVLRRG